MFRRLIFAPTLMLMLLAAPASAEVVQRSADSFTLHYSETAGVGRGDVLMAIESVAAWWDSAHTYSGEAANLRLDLTPGGCLCEALADGTTFEHGRVTAFDDDQLTLDAPLGPLKGRATRADLTFSWSEPAWPTNGDETRVTLSFVIEGPGLGAFADAVDQVMQGQYDRLLHLIDPDAAATRVD